MDTREAAYYEYIVVESGSTVEDAWQLVGVYGGRVLNWMVFRRHIPNDRVAR